MISLDMVPIPNPNVIGRIVNDEAVLVLPVKGQVKVFNEVGTRIWSSIDGIRTVGEIIQIILAEYTVCKQEAFDDTCSFLSKLADREMISFSSGK